MTVAESQQMGALLTGVEKVALIICRCQIYEALYLKQQPEQETWKLAIANLTTALVTLYAAIFGFLASAIQTYRRGVMSRALCAILTPAEAVGFLEKCQNLENQVAIEVENCEHIHMRHALINSDEHIQILKQLLQDLQMPILRIDTRVADLCEKSHSSERLHILEWISSIRHEEHHCFARLGRTSGTCKWLLRHERYHEWRDSSASMILWLHGDRKCH